MRFANKAQWTKAVLCDTLHNGTKTPEEVLEGQGKWRTKMAFGLFACFVFHLINILYISLGRMLHEWRVAMKGPENEQD